jgi:hypothetical protein
LNEPLYFHGFVADCLSATINRKTQKQNKSVGGGQQMAADHAIGGTSWQIFSNEIPGL